MSLFESLFNFIPFYQRVRLYFAYTYRFIALFLGKFHMWYPQYKNFPSMCKHVQTLLTIISKGCTGSTHADFSKSNLATFFPPIQSFFQCCAVMSVVVNCKYLRSFFQFFLLQMVVLFIWIVFVSCVRVGELVGNFLTTVRKSVGITDLM